MIKFSPSETAELRSLLRRLYRNDSLRPSMIAAQRARAYLADALKQDVNPYDEFGLNKINTSLEAILLASQEIGLSGKAMTAFLLHSLTPTAEAAARIHRIFGDEVGNYVDAFARIDALDTRNEVIRTDNFRNLLVSQAGDMRVLLLKVADCVNRMRKIKDTPNTEGQRHLSYEAAYLYAPLSHKLGLYTMKSELEDLSLKYLEHDAYYHIKEKLSATKKSRDAYIERFTAPIRELLDAEHLHYTMKGRTKSIHSIWQKMKKQNCAFEGVYDLFAIRIILDSPPKKELDDCWKVFSLITDRYEANEKRMRDWLSAPKSNGYESLHITVKGPEDKWVEVQIRTARMDEIAEHGLAAHWRYKGVKQSAGGIDAWLANIRGALETGDETQLKNSLSASVKEKNVYVFTPKGDLFRLPAGATVLDFAYHIHSAVGNRCVGARINGRNVPLRQTLNSGETVEVVTSNSQTPKAEWQQIVVSSHARDKIRSAVKELQARESVMGRELMERRLKNRKLEWDETTVNHVIRKMGYKEVNDFFKDVASGALDMSAVIDTYMSMASQENAPQEASNVRSAEEFVFEKLSPERRGGENDVLVIDRNLRGLDFQMARCCNPVYGDEVFGFVSVSGGIKIHRKNCPNAKSMRERFGYRIVNARWAGKGSGKYPITLRVVGHDDLGIVNNITSIISKEEKIMLRSISIDSDNGLFFGILTVMVDSTDVLNALIKKLNTVRGVKSVSRA